MFIRCHAFRNMQASATAAFGLLVDPVRFPPLFTGFGPIAALRSATLDGPLAPGSTRRVVDSNGATLTETVVTLAPPHQHAYQLSGFGPPFSWLVRSGHADWRIHARGETCLVHWDYLFVSANPVLAPCTFVLLKLFMAGAMRRCLDNMALALETDTPSALEREIS